MARLGARIGSWAQALRGCNVDDVSGADPIARWLVISRACVFAMTIFSALIGTLLAAADGYFRPGLALLSLAGLVAAHAANNLLNDYLDVKNGVDSEDYPRAQYAPHPLLGGLTTPRRLLQAILVLNLVDAAIMLYLGLAAGRPWVFAFALAGLALSVFYVAGPIKLKHRGLGELTALVVWGPLMTGGTYYVVAGIISPLTWLATLPYGLLVATVLVGKHIDKLKEDASIGVHSIPVLLGGENARVLNMALMVLFFLLLVVLVAVGAMGFWILLTLLALPHLLVALRHYARPRPDEAPPGWTVWPLWYVGWAMLLNRRVGQLFVLGLILNVVWAAIRARFLG
ncbi:MAG: prenyltransferase [Anaerolineae bacterium]|jgi:1,4-dihydroxy-2-naphthoate octaprenyltransferase|nr:prenyltransferase [Anaerolineae bacterium]MDX9831885.1 prenyltransferase [Anaerolineae bacterium]